MKLLAVPIVVSVLALIQFTSAQVCAKVPVYNATIANICAKTEDNNIYWADYQNANQYYRCQGIGNPVLQNCLPNYVFDFVAQVCTLCAKYNPAPPCQALKGKICTPFKPVATPAPRIPTTIAPSCDTLGRYTKWFVPTCLGIDERLLWPNYKNMSQYYICQGKYNPLIEDCAKGLYFNYYAQKCTDCASYVAAPVCSNLPFDKSNKCQNL